MHLRGTMNQQSFYKCSLFDEKILTNDFSFVQDELLLESFIDQNKSSFSIKKIEYKCKYIEKIKLSNKKPVGIIPIKDNISLLKFTLNNLFKNKVFDHIDFIVVDDRSTENIKTVCDSYPVNYLRVDNNKGFNFSMLNNIAAKIASDNGAKEIVLWNSDLWADSEKTIPKLIKLHKKNNSTISGTRLLYPIFSWDGQQNSNNIMTIFPQKADSYRDTIQFGGSAFIFNPLYKTYFPIHFCRFKEKDYYLAKTNKLENFVTGAFQIIDLKWFLESGGLNPSLAKAFQDVDLCLKAVSEDKKVFYFGEDNFLFHDESVSLSEKKVDVQFESDHILYQKLWPAKKIYTDIKKII